MAHVLSPAQAALAKAIAARAILGMAVVSDDELADEIGSTPRSVAQYLVALEDAGLITFTRRPRGNGAAGQLARTITIVEVA